MMLVDEGATGKLHRRGMCRREVRAVIVEGSELLNEMMDVDARTRQISLLASYLWARASLLE